MKTFLKWLAENVANNITIGLTDFQKAMKGVAERHIDGIRERQYKVSVFSPEKFIQLVRQTLVGYPLVNNLVRALQSNNHHYIMDQQNRLRKWIMDQKDYRKTEKMREISMEIYTYMDYLDKGRSELKEQDVWDLVKKAIDETRIEMEKIKRILEEAISRIAHWNGSPVHIEADYAQDLHGILLEKNDGAHITIGTGEFAPSFMYFVMDGKIEIEDILEGGDEEFFKTPQLQADYFNLINELKKPGSTAKGRILTLYTARPVADRQQLQNSRTLPVNVFLTNTYSHAEGLAMDLPGGKRDVWLVRIDSKYLTQTLDGPVKYYHITVPNAPVRSMELYATYDDQE